MTPQHTPSRQPWGKPGPTCLFSVPSPGAAFLRGAISLEHRASRQGVPLVCPHLGGATPKAGRLCGSPLRLCELDTCGTKPPSDTLSCETAVTPQAAFCRPRRAPSRDRVSFPDVVLLAGRCPVGWTRPAPPPPSPWLTFVSTVDLCLRAPGRWVSPRKGAPTGNCDPYRGVKMCF